MLKALWAWPAQDKRLWPYMEALLEDTSPCFFGSPPRFAEMRWLAAQALVADYRAQGVKRSVHLPQAVAPVSAEALLAAAHRENLVVADARKGLLIVFAHLQTTDQLERRDITLPEPP